MSHGTNARFWINYKKLPDDIQRRADENFELLKADPRHPSLQFKRVGRYWSVRVGSGHRALGRDSEEGIVWFWIGPHDEYKRLIQG